MVIHMLELNQFKHQQMWQVPYLQMSSSVLRELFSRLAPYTDGPAKMNGNDFFFFLLEQTFSNHNTFEHLLLGLASGSGSGGVLKIHGLCQKFDTYIIYSHDYK